MTYPHLAKTHPQYPNGFPKRENDNLLGHWDTPNGKVIVEHHPHGYEIHFNPCYDFDNCDACSPDRPPHNPHTKDGHHFRECQNRGMVLTHAGDKPRSVLEYLAMEGSEPHVAELEALLAQEAAEEAEMRRVEREESDRQLAEQEAAKPSPEERLAALEAELAALRESILADQ